MGLGKTLEMIALIITNFKDDKPLALPVQGTVRRSKKLRALKKEQVGTELFFFYYIFTSYFINFFLLA